MPDIESTFRPRLAGSGPFLPESGLVTSVFGRVGDVEGEPGDYSSSEIGNASGVPGFSVSDALDVLALLASGASPQLSQVVSVSNSGNDTTGTGSSPEPFATVPAAMDAIAGFGDASPTKRYAVVLAPGNYPANFDLPANVFLVGMQREATRITAPIITLDATWSPAGDHRSGLQNLIITGGPKSFNFIPPASNEGKLFFRNCAFNQTPSWSSFSAINQVTCDGCTFFAGFTQNNCNCVYTNTATLNGGAILINGVQAHSTSASFFGGGCDGNVSVLQGLTAPPPAQVELVGFQVAKARTFTINGAGVVVNANPGCLPSLITLLGGAVSPRPVITGAKGGNAALISLMPALQAAGLVTNSTT